MSGHVRTGDFHVCPVCGGVLWIEPLDSGQTWPMHHEKLEPRAPVCAASGRTADEALALGRKV